MVKYAYRPKPEFAAQIANLQGCRHLHNTARAAIRCKSLGYTAYRYYDLMATDDRGLSWRELSELEFDLALGLGV